MPDIISIYGGDGTLNEVVNGLMSHSKIPILKLIPSGTGNSFSKGIFKESKQKKFLYSDVVEVDMVDSQNIKHKKYFIACAGIGFNAEIVKIANKNFKFLNKRLAYPFTLIFISLMRLGKLGFLNLSIKSEDITEEMPSISNCLIHNCGFMANYHFSPNSKVNDGLIEFIFHQKFNAFQLVRYATNTLFRKEYNNKRNIILRRAYSNNSIKLNLPTSVHLDGEITENIIKIKFTVMKNKLIFDFH